MCGCSRDKWFQVAHKWKGGEDKTARVYLLQITYKCEKQKKFSQKYQFCLPSIGPRKTKTGVRPVGHL